MPRSGGTAGQLIATENVQLGGYALSNDGDNEGIYIDNDGNARLINDKWLTVEKIKAIDSDGILIADDSGSNGIQVADGGALSLIGTASMSSDELTEGSTNLFLTAAERSALHTQNTDTGTTSPSFQLHSGSGGARLKNSSGVLQGRNAADDDFVSVQAEDFLDSAGESILPENPTMWHDQSVATNGNAITTNHDAAQNYGTYSYQNTSADNDAFENYFSCKEGTYTLKILGYTSSSSAKIDITIDGVSIATVQDWYSASPTYNVVKTVAGIALAAGKHTLKCEVNGRNASALNYAIVLTKFWLERTGA